MEFRGRRAVDTNAMPAEPTNACESAVEKMWRCESLISIVLQRVGAASLVQLQRTVRWKATINATANSAPTLSGWRRPRFQCHWRCTWPPLLTPPTNVYTDILSPSICPSSTRHCIPAHRPPCHRRGPQPRRTVSSATPSRLSTFAHWYLRQRERDHVDWRDIHTPPPRD